ncbi:hypothetical protein [Celeribacter persicus]|uniref:Uncharacterized protein n=1 Tax=Celeribacter persicus TaxID=1651082 RepID=A0A2T5HSZ9_9RHOB|nr:hypothetical protein [Celeribacter persicus]PTQ74714.1 hypothetical protein C8N42_1033 [Celeribacter persicus]
MKPDLFRNWSQIAICAFGLALTDVAAHAEQNETSTLPDGLIESHILAGPKAARERQSEPPEGYQPAHSALNMKMSTRQLSGKPPMVVSDAIIESGDKIWFPHGVYQFDNLTISMDADIAFDGTLTIFTDYIDLSEARRAKNAVFEKNGGRLVRYHACRLDPRTHITVENLKIIGTGTSPFRMNPQISGDELSRCGQVVPMFVLIAKNGRVRMQDNYGRYFETYVSELNTEALSYIEYTIDPLLPEGE